MSMKSFSQRAWAASKKACSSAPVKIAKVMMALHSAGVVHVVHDRPTLDERTSAQTSPQKAGSCTRRENLAPVHQAPTTEHQKLQALDRSKKNEKPQKNLAVELGGKFYGEQEIDHNKRNIQNKLKPLEVVEPTDRKKQQFSAGEKRAREKNSTQSLRSAKSEAPERFQHRARGR